MKKISGTKLITLPTPLIMPSQTSDFNQGNSMIFPANLLSPEKNNSSRPVGLVLAPLNNGIQLISLDI